MYKFKWQWIAEHHIRDVNELVNYIGDFIHNANAFNVQIPVGNIETIEVSSIANLRSYFCYVWNGEILGKYSKRNQYCYCTNCRNDWKTLCKNKQIVGKWEIGIQKEKGIKTVEPYVSNKKRKT